MQDFFEVSWEKSPAQIQAEDRKAREITIISSISLRVSSFIDRSCCNFILSDLWVTFTARRHQEIVLSIKGLDRKDSAGIILGDYGPLSIIS